MTALRILVALLLLILGRQIFWLFVGGVGFITAMNVVSYWAAPSPPWLTLVIALVAGIIGALLAIFLQEIAVGVAGFLAGGSVVLGLIDMIGVQVPALTWILVLVGAVFGLILALLLFDWALIILSSLSGAALLAQSFNLSRPISLLVFVIALIVGIAIQMSLMKQQGGPRKSPYQEREAHA